MYTVKTRIEKETDMDGTQRRHIQAGCIVDVVQKQDQRTGRLTRGTVRDLLTKSPTHSRGIKVRLESGIVGRVKSIIPADPGL